MRKRILTLIFLFVSVVCFSMEQYTEKDSLDKLKQYDFKINLDNKYSIDSKLKGDDSEFSAQDFSSNIALNFKRKVFYGKNKSNLNIKLEYLYDAKTSSEISDTYIDNENKSYYKYNYDIDLYLYELTLNYEKLIFNYSNNNFNYFRIFAYHRVGRNRFREEILYPYDLNLKLINLLLILGNGFGQISKNYELYWDNKFDKITNNKHNSELILGIKLDYKSINIQNRNLLNNEYYWKDNLFQKFSLGLKGNFEKYFLFNPLGQSRINMELNGGLSFCEDWKDKIGIALQSKLNYEIFKKIFGKTVNYKLQAVYEAIKFKREIPQRLILIQNINVTFDLSNHFSIVPAVGFRAKWFADSNSGTFYISTYDDFSYSGNRKTQIVSEFSLKILYDFK